MWELLYLELHFLGYQYIFSRWYQQKDRSFYLIYALTAGLITLLLLIRHFLFFIPLFVVIFIAYALNMLFHLIWHKTIDQCLVPICLQCIMNATLIPFYDFIILEVAMWQYVMTTLCCLLMVMLLVADLPLVKIDFEWMRHFYLYDAYRQWQFIAIALCGTILAGICVTIISPQNIISIVLGFIMIYVIALVTMLFLRLFMRLKYQLLVSETMMSWQKESRDYMNVIRSQRHDFNFHLHAIVGLIENGDYEECRQYLKNMTNDASMINDIMPIHDAVIGSMLYNMKQNAAKKGIDIEYNITYDLEHVLCNGFEINKILGNLIQNAIDATTSDVEKDYGIKVSIFKRRGQSVIIVSNLYQGDKTVFAHIFDLGYSTKRHHEGIGLSMVSRTVEKYNGRIYTEFDGDIVKFIVNIPNMIHFEEEHS